jgi:ketosteroid isomerase-like protein
LPTRIREMEYVTSGAIPDQADAARGVEEYKEFLSWLTDVFESSRLEPIEFLDAGDHVVGGLTVYGRGKQSGVETSWSMWQVWTLRDGKFVYGQGFTSRKAALEAAGLSE